MAQNLLEAFFVATDVTVEVIFKGPLANDPQDLALVLSLIAGRDEYDSTSSFGDGPRLHGSDRRARSRDVPGSAERVLRLFLGT